MKNNALKDIVVENKNIIEQDGEGQDDTLAFMAAQMDSMSKLENEDVSAG